MIYSLIIIIILLIYIAFFTPEKRQQREIKRVQRLFNTPLYPNAEEFSPQDDRNDSNPNEIVKFGLRYLTRKEARLRLGDVRKKFPNLQESEIEIIARSRL